MALHQGRQQQMVAMEGITSSPPPPSTSSASASTISTSPEQLLTRLYYDPKSSAGYASIDKLVAASNLPRATVLKWLRAQPTYTLHAPARSKGYPTRAYIVHDIDEQWQADLADMGALERYNNGYRFILTVIDLFSRYAWARPLRTKRGREVAAAFANIFQRDGRVPKRVQTDQGREFENQAVRTLFNKYNIELFSIKSAYKAAVVERFNRTLKGRLYRYFTANITNVWTKNNALADAVHAYNHSIHRILKRRPADIHAGNVDAVRAVWSAERNGSSSSTANPHHHYDVNVGDTVRLSKVKGVFARGYLPQWTEEYFVVDSIDQRHSPTTYRLRDSAGEVIEGSFYREEIELIYLKSSNTSAENDDDDDDAVDGEPEFMVERVLRRRRQHGEMWALVKWYGYPSSMNSWVRQRDLHNVSRRYSTEEL